MEAETVSLKQYFEQRFLSSEKEVAVALAAAKEATSKAETAMEKRFDSVNEFRSTLSDQQRTFMPRTEVELMISSLSSRLKKFEDTKIEGMGEASGAKNLWIVILSILSFVSTAIGIVAYFTKH